MVYMHRIKYMAKIGKFMGDDEGRLALTRRVRDQIEDRLHVWLSLQNITPKEYRQK